MPYSAKYARWLLFAISLVSLRPSAAPCAPTTTPASPATQKAGPPPTPPPPPAESRTFVALVTYRTYLRDIPLGNGRAYLNIDEFSVVTVLQGNPRLSVLTVNPLS